MLKASRLLFYTEYCLYPRSSLSQPRVQRLYTGKDEVLFQKMKHLETPEADKKSGKKKGKGTSSFVSAEVNQTFKELKGRVIALRARELRILAGNLSVKENPEAITNPAEILNIKKEFSCPGCNKVFKTKNNLQKHHQKKCKIKTNTTPIITNNGANNQPVLPADPLRTGVGTLSSQTPEESFSLNPSELLVSSSEESRVSQVTSSRHEEYNKHIKVQEIPQYEIKSVETLLNYFDVYVNVGPIEEAYQHFKYLHTIKTYKDVIQDINVYNIILRGWGRKGDLSSVQEIWKDMMMRNIKPDLNSYIASMISFSHHNSGQHIYKSLFRQVFEEFSKEGYTIEQALKKGWFQGDDRKQFIKSLDFFSDERRPTSLYPNMAYSNPLLDNIPTNQKLLNSQVEGVLTRDQLTECYEKQSKSELLGVEKVNSIFSEKFEVSEEKIKFADEIFLHWKKELTVKLTKLRDQKLKNCDKKPFISYYRFLSAVPVHQVVDIIIGLARELCEESETFSMPASQLKERIGNELFQAYLLNTKLKDPDYLDHFNKVFSDYLDWYSAPEAGTVLNHRAAMLQGMKDINFNENEFVWPNEVITMVGSELKDIMIDHLMILRDRNGQIVVNNQILRDNKLLPPVKPISSNPAFYKIVRVRNKEGGMMDETKPHPSLFKLMENQNMKKLSFKVDEMPAVCPPMPWLSVNNGASFFTNPCLIRTKWQQVSNQLETITNLPEGRLDPVLDAVNQLSSVPWKVHQAVLDLAKEVFLDQNDKEVMDILGLPMHPDSFEQMLPPVNRQSSKEMAEYYQDWSELQKSKKESFSLWCDSVYRLSLANHFRDDVLWFPHNMDFRGRVYPVPPYLNHMGNDLAKALLIFAKGKPLGKEGFKWLKLHCINLTGLKKRDSVQDRLDFAESNMDLILDSAERPLKGKRWFLESDEPWLTFSVCNEIKAALECPEGPENYVSHLPIHQDGSCNGLQHYAAIGRDKLGAASVNLVPASKPQDVYSEIAALVERKRSEDASKGNQIAQVLEGFIIRKVVKQTVMTTVYGVTRFGASKQIAKQLKDISEFPEEFVSPGSKYLSAKTFESLNELFTASQEIQDWLTECAKVISSDCQSNVEWTTPLGLPVEQPYSYNKSAEVVLQMGEKPSYRKGNNKKKIVKVNSMKHKNGFAPNFIHSLDSSHMMLTSMYLWRLGINFASVHDCYWTHACDVEEMNRVCRQEFVALHSYPILETISQSFKDKYLLTSSSDEQRKTHQKYTSKHPNRLSPMQIDTGKREMLFNNVPKKGDLDLNVVNDSVYFFS